MNRFRSSLLSGLALQSTDQRVAFGLTDTLIPIQLWQAPGHNLITVSGKLTLGGQPVGGAEMRLDEFELAAPTAQDGMYKFLYDQTVLAHRTVRVADASQARVAGRSLSDADRQRVQAATAGVNTVYVMTLDQPPNLKQGERNVKLSGRLTFADKKTPVPPVALWDYILRGVIRDEHGKPLANAIASISAEGGEQSGLSNVTGDDGVYTLRFFPESDDHYEIRVGYGPDLYTSGAAVTFATAKSAEMDLVVTLGDSMVMGTGPHGALVPKELPGAEYIGTMTGLADARSPIHTDVTWPDVQGRFQITIPVVNFAGPVNFYQAELRFFSAAQEAPGRPIAESIQPTQLTADMPRGLSAITVGG